MELDFKDPKHDAENESENVSDSENPGLRISTSKKILKVKFLKQMQGWRRFKGGLLDTTRDCNSWKRL